MFSSGAGSNFPVPTPLKLCSTCAKLQCQRSGNLQRPWFANAQPVRFAFLIYCSTCNYFLYPVGCLQYDNAHTILQIRAKNPQQREMVAGHMAHLPSTQEAHYINPLQCDESVVAFEAIQSLYVRLQPQRNKCFVCPINVELELLQLLCFRVVIPSM